MSQQCTLFKVVVVETSVEIFESYFSFGSLYKFKCFCKWHFLLLAWYLEKNLCKRNFERIYAVRYNPYSKTSIWGSLVSKIPIQWGHCPNDQRNYLSLFLSAITLGRTATLHKAIASFLVHQEKIDDR